MKTVLIVAANNSLSHVGKALALRAEFIARGHRVVIAAGQRFAWFFDWLEIPFERVTDIQESDGSSFPTISWFIDANTIRNCLHNEVTLIRKVKPDIVIGIFRFTLKVAAQITGIPYYTLSCGCLLLENEEPLGLHPDDSRALRQKEYIDYFFRYAGNRLERAFRSAGWCGEIDDGRSMLVGEKTFLWDFPEFMPVKTNSETCYCGPLEWHKWPSDNLDYTSLKKNLKPVAVVSFGTCNISQYILRRITKNLLQLDYHVVATTAGHDISGSLPAHPDLQLVNMISLPELFARASLLITHGGQLTIFAAIRARVPTLVMPFQPEQAHNAICLERIGCGASLIDIVPFSGKADIYCQTLAHLSDKQIRKKIKHFPETQISYNRLSYFSNLLQNYNGAKTTVDTLEQGDSL